MDDTGDTGLVFYPYRKAVAPVTDGNDRLHKIAAVLVEYHIQLGMHLISDAFTLPADLPEHWRGIIRHLFLGDDTSAYFSAESRYIIKRGEICAQRITGFIILVLCTIGFDSFDIGKQLRYMQELAHAERCMYIQSFDRCPEIAHITEAGMTLCAYPVGSCCSLQETGTYLFNFSRRQQLPAELSSGI